MKALPLAHYLKEHMLKLFLCDCMYRLCYSIYEKKNVATVCGFKGHMLELLPITLRVRLFGEGDSLQCHGVSVRCVKKTVFHVAGR